MKLGYTAFRATLGGVFFAHGAQKLFGWFGGHGPAGTGGFFDSIGLKPGRRNALIAGGAEAGGGLLMTLGLLTPLASAALVGVMGQAVRTVHWRKGFFNTEGGYEYNLMLAAAAVAVADAGPGPWSLDSKLGLRTDGTLWAMAALGAGLAGPALLERLAPAEEGQPAAVEEQPAPVREPARFVRETQRVPAA